MLALRLGHRPGGPYPPAAAIASGRGSPTALELLEDRTVLTFAAAVLYPVTTLSAVVLAADFNGDGNQDLVSSGTVPGLYSGDIYFGTTVSMRCWAAATAPSRPPPPTTLQSSLRILFRGLWLPGRRPR